MPNLQEIAWIIPNTHGLIDVDDVPLGALRWMAEIGVGIEALNHTVHALRQFDGDEAIAYFTLEKRPHWFSEYNVNGFARDAFLCPKNKHGEPTSPKAFALEGQQKALNILRSLGGAHA